VALTFAFRRLSGFPSQRPTTSLDAIRDDVNQFTSSPIPKRNHDCNRRNDSDPGTATPLWLIAPLSLRNEVSTVELPNSSGGKDLGNDQTNGPGI
jgi:hypothetical protein